MARSNDSAGRIMNARKHPTGAGISTPVTQISVTQDYAIGADAHSWQVQKRQPRNGADAWEPITWHATLEQAAASLRERLVRLPGSQTIGELRVATDDASTIISLGLAPQFEVREVVP